MIADVHCHTFNADDLPVRGFIERVLFGGSPLGRDLAWLVDTAVQGAAPGFRAENAKLDLLLSGTRVAEMFELERIEPSLEVAETLERETDDVLAELQVQHPERMKRLQSELAAAEPASVEAAERLVPSDIWRAVRWAILFGKYRVEITRYLNDLFNRVELFSPLLVDLDLGLGDVAGTTMNEQVVLQEKISRLSMQGRLVGRAVHVHPFVGFDPRRELRSRFSDEIEPPLEGIRKAVELYGVVGVKVYPPMGWRPLGNEASTDMSAVSAEHLDEILREFYGWCESEHVPITAHCNDSNYADSGYKGYGSPECWVGVLREFPKLRINLGHFGGARKKESDDGWPWRIARAARDFEGLYADVGNHEIHDEHLTRAYIEMLKRMMSDDETKQMTERLLFGTDWYMVALHPEHERFVEEYERLYRAQFGDDATSAFMGRNALSFLGFDDPNNKNAKRVRARYEKYSPDALPDWLGSAGKRSG